MKVIPAVLGFLALNFLVMTAGCKQSTDSSSPPRDVANATLTAGGIRMMSNVDEWYNYCVHTNDFFTHPDSILCEVRKPDGTPLPSFGLYDDGGSRVLQNPAFASLTSGDASANDRSYSRSINSVLLSGGMQGNYDFHFVFYGGGAEFRMANGNHVTVPVTDRHDCEFTELPQDSVFEECFEPRTLTVRVRPFPGDTIGSVQMFLAYESPIYVYPDTVVLTPIIGDSVWQYAVTPAYFQCVHNLGSADSGRAWGRMIYTAHTRSGGLGTSEVRIASFSNQRPTLTDPVMPDTAFRGASPGDTNRIVVMMNLHDCEYASDPFGSVFQGFPGISSIWHCDTITLDSMLGGWWTVPLFQLKDNGQPPDVVAGDGTFSAWFDLPYSSDPAVSNLLFTFRFQGHDCAHLDYDTLYSVIDSIRVIQPQALRVAQSGIVK